MAYHLCTTRPLDLGNLHRYEDRVSVEDLSSIHDVIHQSIISQGLVLCAYSLLFFLLLGSHTFNFTVEASGATFYNLHVFDDCAKGWLTLSLLLVLQTLQKLIIFYTNTQTHLSNPDLESYF